MKKNLFTNGIRNVLLGLSLSFITVSTVWATTFESNSSEASLESNPIPCTWYYVDGDQYDYIFDCETCSRTYFAVALDLSGMCN